MYCLVQFYVINPRRYKKKLLTREVKETSENQNNNLLECVFTIAFAR